MAENVGIRVKPEEHEALEKKAKSAGFPSLQEAAKTILMRWAGALDSPLGSLNAKEERLLSGVLGFLRHPDSGAHPVVLHTIDWMYDNFGPGNVYPARPRKQGQKEASPNE